MRQHPMLNRVIDCLRAVSPREETAWPQLTRDTCLVSDLWLTAEGITRLGELLEEEFKITLTPSALVGLALDGPLICNLVAMVEAADV